MISRPWWDLAARALVFVIVAVEVLVVAGVRYLPMNDASSHLATGVIALGLWRGDPFFAEHYLILPKPLPYWATTLALVPLLTVLAALTSMVVIVCAYLLALPAGFRVLAGGGSGVPLVASIVALAAFHRSYWLGETNFILGLALFLVAMAVFVQAAAESWRGLAAFCVLALGLYACHIYAMTALLIALSSLAALHLWGRWRGARLSHPWAWRRQQWLALGFVTILFGMGAYFVLFEHGTSHHIGRFTFDVSPRRFLRMVLDLFLLPDGRWTMTRIAVLIGFGSTYLAAAYQGLRGGDETSSSRMGLLVPAIALVLAAWVGPATLVDDRGELVEGQISERFLAFGAFLLLAALPIGRGGRTRRLLLAGVALFAVVRLTEVAAFHRSHDAAMRKMSSTLLAHIPDRSRVLPINEIADPTRLDSLWERLVNYAPIERHSYSPMIFSVPGQQVLRHVPWGSDFRAPYERGVSEEEWGYYDLVLVQSRDWDACLVCGDGRVELVAANGDFRLYRVRALARGRPPVIGPR